MASLALGIAGAAIGSLFGMPALGFALGSAIGSALFPAKGPDGPRLQDLKLQTSSYGKMIPILYGGNRVGGNVIWTTDLQEHKRKGGGKGGPTVTTFTYTASFAVLFCEGPVQTIRRLWADSTLVYDTTTASPLPSIPMTVYLGTDVQAPDPTMESIIGVGLVPANHGYCYAVFTDWDLGNFGNRLPSLNAEIITVEIPTIQIYVVLQYTPAGPWRTGYYHIGAPDPYIVSWDATDIRIANFPFYDTLIADAVTLAPTGTVPHAPQDAYPARIDFNVPMVGLFTAFPAGVYNDVGLYFDGSVGGALSGGVALFLGMGVPTADALGMRCPFDFGSLIPAGLFYAGSVESSDRTQVYLFTHGGTWSVPADPLNWWKFTGSPPVLVDSGTIAPGGDGFDSVFGMNGMCVASLGNFVKGTFENNAPYLWRNSAANMMLMQIGDDKVLRLLRVGLNPNALFPVPNPESPVDTGQASSAYSPATGYCGVCFGNNITLLSRIPPNPATSVPLSDIVSDLSVRAGLSTSDIDVTQLVDLVDGYIIEQQSTARDCVTPLQTGFFFDGVESGAQIKFVKRGHPSALTIPDNDLAAAQTNSSPPALLPWKRQQEVDLPASITVNYINGDAAYQIGTQYGRRLVTSSQLALTSQLAINMTDAKASSVAWTLLVDAWLGRETYTVRTSRKYWYLEPTDVITAHGFVMRITGKRDQLDGVMEFEAIATSESVWVQGPVPGGIGTGGGTDTPPILQLTNALLLDIPLITDTDVQAGFYAAYAGATDDTWRGAALLKSYDLGASFTTIDAQTTANTIGTATTVLPNFYGGDIFDELNSVTVVIGNGGGDLASDSETNVLNWSNAALLGDEIIQFKNAVLTAPSTYDLSGLLRGRRGSEWAMATHVINERFVLLPVDDINSPQSDVGAPLTYAAVTQGGSVATTPLITFENDGAGARCYAPVQVYGSIDTGTGDVTIRWTRRTRVGGQWQNMTDVPLSEATELYVVQIWNSDYTLCARVIQGITTPTTVYTGADQVTDFGAEQLQLFVTVGQIGLFGLGTQAGAILDGNGATIDAPLAPVAPYNEAPPVAPPTGGCTGTVYNQTITWALGDSGIILQPPFFDKNSKWVQKITTPGSGRFRIRIWWFEYGGAPGMRHVTMSTSPCGAPLIPALTQNQFYPQILGYMGAPNPYPTQFATLLPATDYYFTITVDVNGSLPMAYEIDIEAI